MIKVEKRLKDYRGYAVWRVTDNKGMKNETVVYMLNDPIDGENLNCFKTLYKLKKWADMMYGKPSSKN